MDNHLKNKSNTPAPEKEGRSFTVLDKPCIGFFIMNYQDQIKDPRWQKKRLEILELHDFTCINCNSKEKTLNVHHIKYKKNSLIWEYDDDELTVLCEDCHKELHFYKKLIEESIPNDLYTISKIANLLYDLKDKWSNIETFRKILLHMDTDLVYIMKNTKHE